MTPGGTTPRGHARLAVWQRALELALATYHLAALLPDHERYGLASQLRRAAVSIPSNIAEGYGRSTRADCMRHLVIANGSLLELETQIVLAERIGYVTTDETAPVFQLSSEVGRMLARMIAGLRTIRSQPERCTLYAER